MLSGEPTANGEGLDAPAGKEDPVEFDSSLMSCSDMMGVEEVGGQCQPQQPKPEASARKKMCS